MGSYPTRNGVPILKAFRRQLGQSRALEQRAYWDHEDLNLGLTLLNQLIEEPEMVDCTQDFKSNWGIGA